MALRLMVEGRVVEVAQSAPFCMTDGDARRWGEAGRARREALSPAPVVAAVPTRNVVAAYLLGGVLRPEQARAAEEIALHWHSVTRALHARCGLYAERLPRGPDADAHPAEVNRTARYLGWAAWAGTIAVTPRISLVDLTLDLAVDGLSWRGMRARRGLSQQRARRLCQDSLWRYALMAGWADARLAEAA